MKDEIKDAYERIEALSKAEKQKLLKAAESVDNFKGVLFVVVLLSILFSIVYGVYCVAWQEGKNEGIKRVFKYNSCLKKTSGSVDDVNKCWNEEITNA